MIKKFNLEIITLLGIALWLILFYIFRPTGHEVSDYLHHDLLHFLFSSPVAVGSVYYLRTKIKTGHYPQKSLLSFGVLSLILALGLYFSLPYLFWIFTSIFLIPAYFLLAWLLGKTVGLLTHNFQTGVIAFIISLITSSGLLASLYAFELGTFLINYRSRKIQERAINSGDFQLCQNIFWDKDASFQCQQNVAVKLKKPDLCLKTKDPGYCISWVAISNNDTSVCFKIDEYLQTNLTNNSLAEKGLIAEKEKCIMHTIDSWSGDISPCNTIQTIEWRDRCLSNFAVTHKDRSACQLISSLEEKRLCLQRVPKKDIEEKEIKTYTDPEESIKVQKGEKFQTALGSNPTTGYRWEFETNTNLISLIDQRFKPESELIGAGGVETFTFSALNTGETEIIFSYKRPWEEKVIDGRVFKIKIS
jgi:inhibitor of cysteine peptidase